MTDNSPTSEPATADSQIPPHHRRAKIKAHLTHLSKTAILGILGFISAAAIPIWQIYFVDTANVDIETLSIERRMADGFTTHLNTEELKMLADYLPEHLFYEANEDGKRGERIDYPSFSLPVLQAAYNRARQDLANITQINNGIRDALRELNRYLENDEVRYQLAELRVQTLQDWELDSYIDPTEANYYRQQLLLISRNYAEMQFTKEGEPEINTQALRYLLEDLKEDLNEVIETNTQRLTRLRDNIDGLNSQLTELEEQRQSHFSYFRVEVMASNSGGGNTSLKPMSLLRVEISENTYVDLKLQMEDYADTSVLSENSTSILYYQSARMLDMQEQDRNILNRFWGSTGHAQQAVADTDRNIYLAEKVLFADSLSQKAMFNSLRRELSQHAVATR